jgi:hypothetical protein
MQGERARISESGIIVDKSSLGHRLKMRLEGIFIRGVDRIRRLAIGIM